MRFEIGQIIRFTYHHSFRDASTGEQYKEVLVLHPNWNGYMHGIDLKRLTPAQREVLAAILDPEQRDKPHRLPLVNDIKRRMDPVQLIRNPVGFYAQFVKPFLRGTDAYRTYLPQNMTGVTVDREAQIGPGPKRPENTLFPPKPPPLPGTATTKNFQVAKPPLTPIDVMKANAAKRAPPHPPKPPKLPSRGRVIRGKITKPPKPK